MITIANLSQSSATLQTKGQEKREKGKTKCEQNMNKTRQPSMYKMVVRKESAIFFYPDRNFLHIQPYRQDWKLSHNLQHHIP